MYLKKNGVTLPPDWFQVMNGLLELRRRGVLFAVWVDYWSIHIQWNIWGEREPLPWVRARLLLESYREGPESVIITGEEKEKIA